MNPQLFKSTEFYHRRYHNMSTVLITPLILLVIFLFLFAFFAKKEVTVTSRGSIEPTKVIAVIQSTSDNTIIDNQLVANKVVKKGDTLVQYSETMEASQKEGLQKQLELLKRQESGLKTLQSSLTQGTNLFQEQEDEFGYQSTFNTYLSQAQDIDLGVAKTNTEVNNQAAIASNTGSAIDNQISQLQTQVSEYEALSQAITNHETTLPEGNPHQGTLNAYNSQYATTPDASVTDQYLSQVNTNISSLNASIGNLEIQKAGTGTVVTYDNSDSTKKEALKNQFLQNAGQQLSSVETQINDTESKINQADVLLTNTLIQSPEDGILHLSQADKKATMAATGTELAQLYPDMTQTQEVAITYYVNSDYVPKLQKGQSVRLTLDKVGNHGTTIIGKLESIDNSATETERGNVFRVTARASISEKEAQNLRYGLEGRVTSVIDQKTYFNYFKDKLLNLQDQ